MPPHQLQNLSRRERQIMDILYRLGQCSAQEVLDNIEDPPSYSSIRALIARLVDKDIVQYEMSGKKHIYSPKIAEKKAQSSALSRLVSTFFKGSRYNAVNALLDSNASDLTAFEIEVLERKIQQLKQSAKQEK